MDEARGTLYVSDLDGTLLNPSAELSAYARDTINRLIAGGLDFTIATARTIASVEKILAGLTLKPPIILMNGVLIYDMAEKRYVKVNMLPAGTVAAIIETFRRFDATGFMYELKDGKMMTYHESLESEPLRYFIEERITRYQKSFLHTDGFGNISADNIIYFTLLDTRERLDPVYDALEGQPGLSMVLYMDIYRPGLWYLEVHSANASKRKAVEYLREVYGYGRIVGFGDNLNDLPMFEACDVRIAVGNAKPDVIAAADHVCGANVDDGVAVWLDERFKSQRHS